jgi:hypothetical protein
VKQSRRRVLAIGLSLLLLATAGRAAPEDADDGAPVDVERTRDLARSLDARLAALRDAINSRDLGTALRRQRELLAAVRESSDALGDDTSRRAGLLRAALAKVGAAATGDEAAFAAAAAALRRAEDEQAQPEAATPMPLPPDPRGVLQRISDDLPPFRRAVRDGDLGAALRLQAGLVGDLDVAESATARLSTASGVRLRSVLAQLRQGLDGDPGRLAAAADSLAELVPPRRRAGAAPEAAARR